MLLALLGAHHILHVSRVRVISVVPPASAIWMQRLVCAGSSFPTQGALLTVWKCCRLSVMSRASAGLWVVTHVKLRKFAVARSAFYHLFIPCNLYDCFLSLCCTEYYPDTPVSKAALFINALCGKGWYKPSTLTVYFRDVLNSVILPTPPPYIFVVLHKFSWLS